MSPTFETCAKFLCHVLVIVLLLWLNLELLHFHPFIDRILCASGVDVDEFLLGLRFAVRILKLVITHFTLLFIRINRRVNHFLALGRIAGMTE